MNHLSQPSSTHIPSPDQKHASSLLAWGIIFSVIGGTALNAWATIMDQRIILNIVGSTFLGLGLLLTLFQVFTKFPAILHASWRTGLIGLLLFGSLTLNYLFLWPLLTTKNSTTTLVPASLPTSPSRASVTPLIPTISPTRSPLSGETTDRATIATFLTHLCDLFQTGHEHDAFTQLTTTTYQQNNLSGDFGFASFGGITRCSVPSEAQISLIAPHLVSTDCLVHFVFKRHAPFNHGYHIEKQTNSNWIITTTFSTNNQQNFLPPQCGDFSPS